MERERREGMESGSIRSGLIRLFSFSPYLPACLHLAFSFSALFSEGYHEMSFSPATTTATTIATGQQGREWEGSREPECLPMSRPKAKSVISVCLPACPPLSLSHWIQGNRGKAGQAVKAYGRLGMGWAVGGRWGWK